MYFYGFYQSVWLLTGIALNFIYIYLFFKKDYIYTYNLSILYCYQLLMLVLGRISPGAIISHNLKALSLGLEKDLTVWMFTIWESLFSDHKSESWIPCHIYLYCIFSKKSAVLKNYKILFPQKCFVYICKIYC